VLGSLLSGALQTLAVASLAAMVAVVVAPVAALGRGSHIGAIRVLAGLYIEFFRGTSALVQLYFAYYVLPLFGVTLPALIVGSAVLGLNTGSYGAEVVRGALQAVSKTQREAATALGMSPLLAMRRVVFPQALLAMVPPWTNLFIDLLKGTALVSLIAISDLAFHAQQLRSESGGQNTLQVFLVVILIYLAMAQCIALGGRLLETRLSRGRDVGSRATRLMQ
jgi:polar amino acid transport system permease protein